MEPKSTEAYCSIIQGMAKYYQVLKRLLCELTFIARLPFSTYSILNFVVKFAILFQCETFDSLVSYLLIDGARSVY